MTCDRTVCQHRSVSIACETRSGLSGVERRPNRVGMRLAPRTHMTTILIIVLVVLLLGGGGLMIGRR